MYLVDEFVFRVFVMIWFCLLHYRPLCVWLRFLLTVEFAQSMSYTIVSQYKLTLQLCSFPGCDYQGNTYTQDETWQDGCDFDCVCEDASAGAYTCTDQ